MLELNKQYEARFLGCQVLTRAVTGELLSRLVHALPEVVPSGLRCTVVCSAAGLTVTRPGNAAAAVVAAAAGTASNRAHHRESDNLVTLKVALSDILFCHVDKSRPEVTVWVVRNRSQTSPSDLSLTSNHILPPLSTFSGGGGGGADSTGEEAATSAVLHAYIYRCSNSHDALSLFKVYNEMSRQSRLDKYRRNGEKRDVDPASSSSSDSSLADLQLIQRHLPLEDDVTSSSELSTTSTDSKEGGSSGDSDCSVGDGTGTIINSQSRNIPSLITTPSVTVISNSGSVMAPVVSRPVKVTNTTLAATSSSNPKIAAKLWGQPQKPQPDLRNTLLVSGIHPTSNSAGAVSNVNGRALAPTKKNGGNHQRPEKSAPGILPSSPPTWASIVGSIENYRRSFSTLRPRDKEVRAAMLAELREKLKSRHHDIIRSNGSGSDDNEDSSSSGGASSPTNAGTSKSTSKLLASNRQRKPAKIILNANSTDNGEPGALQRQQHDKRKPHFLSGSFHSTAAPNGQPPNGNTPAGRAFPFPWSMSNMVKKLVHKNKHHYSGGYVIGSVSNGNHHGPPVVTPMLVLPMKGHGHQHHHMGISMPLANNNNNNQTPSRKFKAKKGPAPAPPIPALIKSRMATNGDPFFYLPPITNGTGSAGSSSDSSGSPPGAIVNARNEVFVPVLPPAWMHHNHLHFHHHQKNNGSNRSSKTTSTDSPPPLQPDNGGAAITKPGKTRSSKNQTAGAITNGSAGEGGKRPGAAHGPLTKKKSHVIYGGLSRFARGYKKRSPPPPLTAVGSNFVRTSSTASRGSSSSESGAEGGKLRSVMKKPRPTNDTSPPEQKKNVTFNAYATVQVLP